MGLQYPTRGYTGGFPMMGRGSPGTCGKCGQPSSRCNCGCRECRKEAKELLVVSAKGDQTPVGQTGTNLDTIGIVGRTGATTQAFIGGSCCVTLAVEYAPDDPTTAFSVLIGATDSEGTTLVWEKKEQPGTGYRVHECIITTKPGAKLVALANNCTARVRWCEVFSC